jgi:hypothetical protein
MKWKVILSLLAILFFAAVQFHCSKKSSTQPEPQKDTTKTIVVNGKANIFAAGRSVLPPPANALAGEFPPVLSLASVTHRPITFSSIAGGVSGRAGLAATGPDGKAEGSGTDITPLQGISGIRHGVKVLFLAGVFLNDAEPADPAPDAIDFTDAEHFLEIHPQLKQVFFIGDGRIGTGEGETQKFFVPDGATRLFLGFADAYNFQGAPAFYDDNSGELSVTVNL